MELEVERDGRDAAPLEADVARAAEAQGAGPVVELGGGVDEVGDVGELLGADEGDEIGGIDEAQLGGDVPEAVGQGHLALERIGIALSQHGESPIPPALSEPDAT
jgi:hypothetical protein